MNPWDPLPKLLEPLPMIVGDNTARRLLRYCFVELGLTPAEVERELGRAATLLQAINVLRGPARDTLDAEFEPATCARILRGI